MYKFDLPWKEGSKELSLSSICPSVYYLSIDILTKVYTKCARGKEIQVCTNLGPCHSLKGDESKIYRQHLKISSRINFNQFWHKPSLYEEKSCLFVEMKGHTSLHLFPRGDNYSIEKNYCNFKESSWELLLQEEILIRYIARFVHKFLSYDSQLLTRNFMNWLYFHPIEELFHTSDGYKIDAKLYKGISYMYLTMVMGIR